MKKYVTIRDVAKEAGLSYSTVSLVLSGKADKYHLREQTIQKVLDAAAKLGYVRNINADLFRSGMKQNLVGFLVPSLNTTIYSEIVHGLEQELTKEGLFLVISGTGDRSEHEKEYIEEFIGYRFAGVVSLTNNYDASRYDILRKMNVPTIFMETFPKDFPFHYLSFDDEHGGCLVAKHLVERGHRRLAYLSHALERSPFQEIVERSRENGFRRGLPGRMKIDFSVARVAPDPRRMRTWVKKNCSGENGVTGIFCAQDFIAANCLKALASLEIRVPDDVAVVGFDNLEMCEYLTPPLTSVDLPRFELGVEIGKTLRRLIKQSKQKKSAKPVHKLLKPRLVVRASS